MKTILLTVSMLFLTSNTNANMLVFYDIQGNELLQPVMVESEIEEIIPVDTVELSNVIFDISRLAKPEKEVDDIPDELKSIIK